MELGRRHLLLGLAAVGAAGSAQTAPPGIRHPGDPTETIDLWPGPAPGMPATPPVETVDERSTDPAFPDRAVRGVVRPRMVVFRPATPNGAAVLVAPGGGYARIVIDKEGYEVARWLAARGYTVFVLFYRLPGDGWAAGPDVALSDAQRAMRLIRQRAGAYRLDPTRVAMMGFSAGGHLCGDLATRFDAMTYRAIDAADRLSARPMLAAPIYAVQSMSAPLAHPGSRALLVGAEASAAVERAHSNAANVTARTPPIFMAHAEDDATVPVDNTLEMRAACKRVGVPVETHLFTTGGHGFGLRRAAGKPVAIWPDLFVNWAASMKLA
ncbi:acetyl esterase/lipase [Sphingomonas jinjuensis]|uniref:Acetyl esterase/lipase n=1 Tax=Sphingomonas jinjuensis TaxID=535907 RepID=A0A840F654_9SPHN|nr:alpha/beta hydrolase [Sphingomonas jinjuensis]MBB4153390.1 acetyl esterase/lipase [Sphingomonas jinjuensis]